MHTVAIVGTAGRRDDGPKMSRELYEQMCKCTQTIINDLDIGPYKAVSGGAAWADHIAVRMYMISHAQELTIHLPALLSPTTHRFVEYKRRDTGSITNYYHQQFSKHLGGDSLRGLNLALEKGGTCTIGRGQGFKPRNIKVGAVDTLIAFTFGTGNYTEIFTAPDPGWMKAVDAGLKPGGTSHCWDNSTASMKIHVPLNTLLRT